MALDQKKHPPLFVRIIAWLVLLVIFPGGVLYAVSNQNYLPDDKRGILIYVASVWYSLTIPMSLWAHLLRKFPEKKRLFNFIFMTLMIVWFAGMVYGKSRMDYHRAENVLPAVQNYLTEAETAKLMGDSIIAGRPVDKATFTEVTNIAAQAADNLETLSDASIAMKLYSYNDVGNNWAEQIAGAAGDRVSWKKLPDQPVDFELSLNDTTARKWLKISLQNIQELKEFGDGAIKRKDKETMLYITAKLLVQKHWLNGIIHSQRANFLTYNLADTVYAQPNPNLGLECAGKKVECAGNCPDTSGPCYQSCMGINCSGGNPPIQQPAQKKQNPPQVQQEAPSPTPEFSYSPIVREVCLGVTSGTYCAQEVLQSVNEIAASARGFIEDKKDAGSDWNDSWHALEAMGAITVGGTVETTAEHSPKVQAFYDSCTAKGSTVGGANQNKGRLPTTESGYHFNYKQGVNNCWDYMTYSGSRFMGGDVGCKELNLVPLPLNQQPAQQPANQTKAGKWDGTYNGTRKDCTGATYSDQLIVKNNQVVVNVVNVSMDGNNILIGSDGHVVFSQRDNNYNSAVWVNDFQFSMNGNTATVVTSNTYKDPSGETASCGPSHFEGTR